MNGYDFQKLKYVEDRLTTVGMEIAPCSGKFFVKLDKTSIGTFATLDEIVSYISGYEFGLSRGRIYARDEEGY